MKLKAKQRIYLDPKNYVDAGEEFEVKEKIAEKLVADGHAEQATAVVEAGEEESDVPGPAELISKMKVAQVKSLLESLEVEIVDGAKKEDLVAQAIEAAQVNQVGFDELCAAQAEA